jgi:hypothetical protein
MKYLMNYIDLSSGSYFLQIFLAGVFTIFFGIKMWWNTILMYFQDWRRNHHKK